MALKPADRYRSPRALADDIERWLNDQLVSVYREPPRQRFARWRRNHRTQVAAAAAAALVLLVGGVAATAISRRATERAQTIARVEGLVDSIATADIGQVPAIVKQLAEADELARPLLREKLSQAAADTPGRLRFSLALVAGDSEHVEYLNGALLRADAAAFPVIRDALAEHLAQISDRFWSVLAGREPDPGQRRLRAAGALAKYDPANARWAEVAPEVANQLVSVNPVFVGQWQEALRPVAERLLPPLAKIFTDPEQGELPRTLATSLLADYAKNDPETLTRLVIDADSKAFGVLFPVLQSHQTAAIEKLQAVLDRKVEPTWNDPRLDSAWSEPPAASRAAIEAAHGMLAERFAFCADLPWDEFAKLAEQLSASGYRPTRVRPYRLTAGATAPGAAVAGLARVREGVAELASVREIGVAGLARVRALDDASRAGILANSATGAIDHPPDPEPQPPVFVAAVWTRDGKRWNLETDLPREQLPKPEAVAEKDGLVPADLAIMPTADASADRRFLLLWEEPAATGEQRRIVVDASEQEFSNPANPGMAQQGFVTHPELAKQGFAAQSTIGVSTDSSGQRHYCGIWSNHGAPSELRAAYGGFELIDQPQWDVAVAAAAKLADPLDTYRRQLAEIEKLPPAQADQPQVRVVRAKAEYHLGQLEGALAIFDDLIDTNPQRKQGPGAALSFAALQEVLQYRAWCLARLGKAEEARAQLASYLEQASAASRDAPTDASARAYAQIALAAWLGEHDEAAKQLDAAARVENADALYNAACAAALAGQACAASDAPRAKAFLDRAIELVEAAVAQGYQNSSQLRTDVDLAALHGDSRFPAILDRLEPPARYAAVWRADVEFESRLVTQPLAQESNPPAAPRPKEKEKSGDESPHSKARELAAQGYRPFAICVDDNGAVAEVAVAELARVRDVEPAQDAGILTNSATEKVAELARVRDVEPARDSGILANPATTAGILANSATVEILTNSATGPMVSMVWHRPLVPDAAKEELAQRQATAAAALVRMGATELVWPLLAHRPDPRLRSYLLDRLMPFGVEPAAMLARLPTESDVTRRRALILGIGQFARAKLLSSEQESEATTVLAGWYADDPDSGIHGAAEWSLKQMGAQTRITEVREANATGTVIDDREWYLTKEGRQTLVILRPDADFLMGSPVSEAERFQGPTGKTEIRHRRRIGRVFAIGAHEVTVDQFQKFHADQAFDRTKSREQDAPANIVTWYDAAAYCNWLSDREGIARDQWCYDPDQAIAEGMRLFPDYLKRTGYRLPTEAEWEYACRAGSVTARYFGETDQLLGEYAWFTKNSHDRWMLPVGSLKPNDWGLFDLYGNALEWCQEPAVFFSKERVVMEDKEQTDILSNSQSRVLRGGSFGSFAPLVRSANRGTYLPDLRFSNFGIRVARTYP